LDIPNANTVIIYRSDKLGLAQLHQIRGRVGRSHHQAYAYLLTPEVMSDKASLRLQAIANNMELGSGFQLSVADLEIRGAGNLLGEEQSGHVNAIGLSYYTHLLNQATHSEPIFETEVDIEIEKIIPEYYIPDTESRYKIYHRLANCHFDTELNDITDELTDRYGKIPEPTQNLIEIYQLKIHASKLRISSIKCKQDKVIVDIGHDTILNPKTILSLIDQYPEYKLSGPTHIKIDTNEALRSCKILINRLSP
jgi:transcription-repair coupling factor (superfamily II helicase)